MELKIFREPSNGGATIGRLTIGGIFECWTLEDVIREVSGMPVSFWKVPGKTAIPSGLYRVAIDMSRRFQRMMPRILDVPGYKGILIHNGKNSEHTEGCVLVGRTREKSAIGESRLAFDDLFKKLEGAKEWITLEIQNQK